MSRSHREDSEKVEWRCGDLRDDSTAQEFLKGGDVLFNCAGELKDEAKMWEVNVRGAEKLMEAARRSGASAFCQMSSVGVVGDTTERWIEEDAVCRPQNAYEQSKLAAETALRAGAAGLRLVILRPTNVVDEMNPGILRLVLEESMANRFKLFVKGGECSHLIHAYDVACAAVFAVGLRAPQPEVFCVSCDHEPHNTISDLRRLCEAERRKTPVTEIAEGVRLSPGVTHWTRRFIRGRGNRGDVRYSSRKLMGRGFTYALGIAGAVRRVIAWHDRREIGEVGPVNFHGDGAMATKN